MGTTRNAGSESDANIDWLREIHQPTSPEILYERAINHFKPPPTMPFSYDTEVERLRRELALAESAKIESERRICILRDQIVVHQARQLNQLQQQHQHDQRGCSHLNSGSTNITNGLMIIASIKEVNRSNNNTLPSLVIALLTSAITTTGRIFCHPRSESAVLVPITSK
jgi:hypothetical protein